MQEIHVTFYKALDGEIFDTKEECEEREAVLYRCFENFIMYDGQGMRFAPSTIADFEEAYDNAIVFSIKDTPTWREDLDFMQSYFGFPTGDDFYPGWYYAANFYEGIWERM